MRVRGRLHRPHVQLLRVSAVLGYTTAFDSRAVIRAQANPAGDRRTHLFRTAANYKIVTLHECGLSAASRTHGFSR